VTAARGYNERASERASDRATRRASERDDASAAGWEGQAEGVRERERKSVVSMSNLG
jgi:hypothetical protein